MCNLVSIVAPQSDSAMQPSLTAFVSPLLVRLRPCLTPRFLCNGVMAAPPAATLITWDIDGTLLTARGHSGNAAHKRALEKAVSTIHGVSIYVNDVPHVGATDRAIIRDMCAAGGVPQQQIAAQMDAVIAAAGELIRQYVDKDMRHLVLPGVSEILRRLQERGVRLALATGNLESCAWAKVRAAGLGEFFETGGFGSDCFGRNEIVSTAIERAGGKKERGAFHVGDAVADMVAARENGVGGIGVLTGMFEREEMEREGALVVMEDLSDTQRFLRLVGVEDGANDEPLTNL